jgi:hypothetical protein
MMRLAVILAAIAAVAGCSSLPGGGFLPGGGYPINLESDPPGAEARTSLGQACRTPCTVTVPGRDDFTVTFALAGYETQMVPVTLLRSGGLGSEFAAVQFDPNPVAAQLAPAPPPVTKKKRGGAKPRTATKSAPPTGAERVGPPPSADVPPAQRTIPGAVPPAQRTIPGAQPTAPASAWPPPR